MTTRSITVLVRLGVLSTVAGLLYLFATPSVLNKQSPSQTNPAISPNSMSPAPPHAINPAEMGKPTASPGKPADTPLNDVEIWVIGDDTKRSATRDALSAKIAALTALDTTQARKQLDLIAAELAGLAEILDKTAKPSSPMNTTPPLTRPDGSKYPPQLIFSGMNPDTIQDSEHRQAYLDRIAQNQQNNRIRGWMSDADGDYNGLNTQLDLALRQMLASGALSKEHADLIRQRIARKAGKQ